MFVVEPQYINRKETVSSPTIRFTAIGACVIMKWKTERSYKEEITMLHFGKRLKELRKSAKLTQADLAERLMVSVQTISKWETGNAMPDISQIVPLAALLGVTTDYLLGVTGNEESTRELIRYMTERTIPTTPATCFIGTISGNIPWILK